MVKNWMLAAFAVLACGSAFAAAEPVKDGDRIVFFGDSITAGGVSPKGYVTKIKEALADKKVEIIGAGISGNKVPNLEGRLDKDVLSKKPTIVVIYIGINDVWHGEKDPAKGTTKERFESGLKGIIEKIKAAGARVILCTPSVIGEKNDGSNNLDKPLDEYSEISRKVATDTGSQLCDLRKAFLEHLKANNPKNAEKGILTGDRVHLNEAGNKFVAEQMLAVLNAK